MATIKNRILKLLKKGTPMLSLDMADVLRIDKGAASQAAKELHRDGFLHISEWRMHPKNAGNKVYAYGYGEDAIKPAPRSPLRNKVEVYKAPKVFVPRPDEAAAWLRNPL